MTASTTLAVGKVDPNSAETGQHMHAFVAELFPICRSITGDGLRETLRRIGQRIPMQIHEVASGTQVFDWTVPREWNIRDAYVNNSRGERVIDFRRSNLHVVNYSAPVNTKLPLQQLKKHLHTLPDKPDWIPYRTSYYNETWGFCLSQRQLDALPDSEYEVVIDSSLRDGHLSYGESLIPGESSEEILISCHSCHPSLCNDNLSGIAVATFLAQILAARGHRFTYRFLFIPGTIGSLAWLSRNEDMLPRIKHGLVLACVGDRGAPSYKKSRRGNTEIDRAVLHALGSSNQPYNICDFSPYGYDERQYCSPGFDLPIGCLNRSQHGKFMEYHTSADNLEFVTPEALADTLRLCLQVFNILENNRVYRNLNPKGEPQLGKRGLYSLLGGRSDAAVREMALLWVLNLSDGQHSLLDIAERSGMKFDDILQASNDLQRHALLVPHTEEYRL
jgi:aminopeptidase-like protein